MHILDQRALGIAILVLMGMLVVSKRVATGSIMRDMPVGNVWVWFVHVFNLFFLLVANPLAALFLLTRRCDAFDPTHVAIEKPWLLTGPEIGGAMVYVAGYALMGWALVVYRGSYQAGGTEPRVADELVIRGPSSWLDTRCIMPRCASPWGLRA